MRIRLLLIRLARDHGYERGIAPPRNALVANPDVPVTLHRLKTMTGTESYTEAVHALGLVTIPESRLANPDDVAEDVIRVAHELGAPQRMPSMEDYQERGHYDRSAVTRHLAPDTARWTEAAEELGLEPQNVIIRHGKLTLDDLIQDYLDVCRELERRPGEVSQRAFLDRMPYSRKLIVARIGLGDPWRRFVARAQADAAFRPIAEAYHNEGDREPAA